MRKSCPPVSSVASPPASGAVHSPSAPPRSDTNATREPSGATATSRSTAAPRVSAIRGSSTTSKPPPSGGGAGASAHAEIANSRAASRGKRSMDDWPGTGSEAVARGEASRPQGPARRRRSRPTADSMTRGFGRPAPWARRRGFRPTADSVRAGRGGQAGPGCRQLGHVRRFRGACKSPWACPGNDPAVARASPKGRRTPISTRTVETPRRPSVSWFEGHTISNGRLDNPGTKDDAWRRTPVPERDAGTARTKTVPRARVGLCRNSRCIDAHDM